MSSRKGFTLIELLIVVAIIAVLLALIFPTIAMFKEWRQRLNCGTNLEKIGTIVACYASKYKSFLPCAGTASWWESEEAGPGSTPQGRHYLVEALIECGATAEIFCCPAHPIFDGIQDDAKYYLGNVQEFGVRAPEVHWEGFRSWQPGEYAYAGSKYDSVGSGWMKYYNMPGYAFFTYNPWVGSHPRGGTPMPNHWDTWRYFGRESGATLPQKFDERGRVPIAADEMRWNTGQSRFEGFWHFHDRETFDGSEDDRRLMSFGTGGAHTLFLSGAVEWFEVGEFFDMGPQFRAQGYDYFFGGLRGS